MHDSVMVWFRQVIKPRAIKDKRVLEIGSRDVNGSVRPLFLQCEPAHYLGVDIENGRGVDRILDAGLLEFSFGRDSWDVIVASETLEHVENWVVVLRSMLTVLRPGGLLFITTRSLGFPYHAYPIDKWRYTPDNFFMLAAKADLIVDDIQKDPEQPGVFFKAWKSRDWKPLPPEPFLSEIPVSPMEFS